MRLFNWLFSKSPATSEPTARAVQEPAPPVSEPERLARELASTKFRTDTETRALVDRLVQIGAPAVPALIGLLRKERDEDNAYSSTSRMAIRALGQIGDPL